MAVATFDTLKFANTLKAAGMPAAQAEAQAVAFADIIQLNLDRLVTGEELERATKATHAALDTSVKQIRADLDALAKQGRADLDQAVKELRAESKLEATRLDGKIDNVLSKLTGDMNTLRWMFGAVFAANLTVIGLVLRLSFPK